MKSKMGPKKLQKILAWVQHRIFVTDLKKTYPNKTNKEIEDIIKAVDKINENK